MILYIKLLKTLVFVAVALYLLRFLISTLSKDKGLYAPDPSRHFFMLFWALLCLFVAGPLIIIYFTKPMMQPLEASLLLVFGILLSSFALPVFAIHIQYFFVDFQKLVEIDKKNETFKIYDVRHKLYYRKEDIIRATRVRCQRARYFWSNYEYITFELKNDHRITITSLLLPLDKLTKYLNPHRLEVQNKAICFI